MYYLSLTIESKPLSLTKKNFGQTLVNKITDVITDQKNERGEDTFYELKVPVNLYNEAHSRLGGSVEHQQTYIPIWEKDLLIGYIKHDSNSVEKRHSVSSSTSV